MNVAGAAAPTGGADAHGSRARVLGYVGAEVVDAACRQIPVGRAQVGPDGRVADPGIRSTLRDAARALVVQVAADPNVQSRPGARRRTIAVAIDERTAAEFAARWKRDWNAHDLDALLAHFAPDVVFTSPVAAQLRPDGDGVIRGREALCAYWSHALRLLPDLHFTVEGVYAELDTIAIEYRNHTGNSPCETLRFDGPLVAAATPCTSATMPRPPAGDRSPQPARAT